MSNTSDALREMAKEGLEIRFPSDGWYRGIDMGEDVTAKAADGWAEYRHTCEAIIQQRCIFESRYGHPPAAIYATNELLCVLQRGNALVTNAGKADTFSGLPIRPCGGSGRAFHFTAEIFELREGNFL